MNIAGVSPAATVPAAATLEVLRLATLIYSNLVIFPLGYALGVPFMLATKLRSTLALEHHRIYEPELELWILTMGSIGCAGLRYAPHDASGKELKQWYGVRLQKIARHICNGKWERFIEVLEGYMWLDVVCRRYASEVWREMCGPAAV